MEHQYRTSIWYLDNVSRDGRPWQLLIIKRHLPDADGWIEGGDEVVYSGCYTAQVGAQRAAKRKLKKLNAGGINA